TGQPNLLALTAGDAPSRSRLGGEAMRSLLRQLRERFELVLLGTPCWPAQPGLLPLATASEAAYPGAPAAEGPGRGTGGVVGERGGEGVRVGGFLVGAG